MVCEDCGKWIWDSEDTPLSVFAREAFGSILCDSCTQAYHQEIKEEFEKEYGNGQS